MASSYFRWTRQDALSCEQLAACNNAIMSNSSKRSCRFSHAIEVVAVIPELSFEVAITAAQQLDIPSRCLQHASSCLIRGRNQCSVTRNDVSRSCQPTDADRLCLFEANPVLTSFLASASSLFTVEASVMVSTPRPLSLVPGGLLSASEVVPRVPEPTDRAFATSSPSTLLSSELWLPSPCLCLLRSVNILLRTVRSAEPLLRRVKNKSRTRLPGATAGICSFCRQDVRPESDFTPLLCKSKGEGAPTLPRATAKSGAVQVPLQSASSIACHTTVQPFPKVLLYVAQASDSNPSWGFTWAGGSSRHAHIF